METSFEILQACPIFTTGKHSGPSTPTGNILHLGVPYPPSKILIRIGSVCLDPRSLSPCISPFPLSFKTFPTNFLSSLLPNKKGASGFICRVKRESFHMLSPGYTGRASHTSVTSEVSFNSIMRDCGLNAENKRTLGVKSEGRRVSRW